MKNLRLLLTLRILEFIPVAAYIKIFFFFSSRSSSPLNECARIWPFTMWRTVGLFPVWGSKYIFKDTVGFRLKLCVNLCSHCKWVAESGIAELNGNCVFRFMKNRPTFSKEAATSWVCAIRVCEFSLLHILLSICYIHSLLFWVFFLPV